MILIFTTTPIRRSQLHQIITSDFITSIIFGTPPPIDLNLLTQPVRLNN